MVPRGLVPLFNKFKCLAAGGDTHPSHRIIRLSGASVPPLFNDRFEFNRTKEAIDSIPIHGIKLGFANPEGSAQQLLIERGMKRRVSLMAAPVAVPCAIFLPSMPPGR